MLYAFWQENSIHNWLPSIEYGTSTNERSSGATVTPKLRKIHSFGLTIYAIQNCLQDGRKTTKLNTRARMGFYLDNITRNASPISLVIYLGTAMVSSQFHAQQNDFFEKVRPRSGKSPISLIGNCYMHSNKQGIII